MSKGVDICKQWIDAGFIKPRTNINWSMTSYSMKHIVEQWYGQYVTNDEFINAMVDKGYRAKRHTKDSPNYVFNWSYAKGHNWESVQNARKQDEQQT